jgi:hypothetical protein
VAGEPVDLTEIDSESVRAGCELAIWFRGETERVYAILRESKEEARQRVLAGWIQLHGRMVSARDLQRAKPSIYPTSEEAEKALQELVSSGWGIWRDRPQNEGGGRPTRDFCLNPEIIPDRTPRISEKGEVSSSVSGPNGMEPI